MALDTDEASNTKNIPIKDRSIGKKNIEATPAFLRVGVRLNFETILSMVQKKSYIAIKS